MKCIYCNTPLAGIDYCPGCGADVTLLKRIGRISNLLYNRGLEKASIRDLSGAIACLRQSLKFNKENIDARNLLGLCYYETGEVVSALCEWVISKNMSPDNNPAEYYLDDLQNNKNQLDVINQSIRKYNQSIEYCRADHEDMAVMQLRKVVSSNPKLVTAQQLLALLYMKRREYEKARRVLKKAQAIDNTNTTTIRYLAEVEEATGRGSAFGRRHHETQEQGGYTDGGTLRYVSGTETIIQPTTFRDSSTIATFINIGLGVLLGGAIIWFLAVPASRQQISDSANQQVTDANLQLASGTAQLSDLQSQIENYEAQVESANQDKEDAEAKVAATDALVAAATQYVNGEVDAAVTALDAISSDQLDEAGQTLYDSLRSAVGSSMFAQYYSTGTTAYVNGDYSTAAQQLQNAVDADPNGEQSDYKNALYYLGFAYYNLGDSTKADEIFNMYIEKYPSDAASVQYYLSTSASTTDTSTAASQGEASLQDQSTTTDSSSADTGTTLDSAQEQITIVDTTGQSVTSDDSTVTYDESQVAWTDPTTGLHYDVNGNLLG